MANFVFILLALFCYSPSLLLASQIYQYTNDQGRKIFVDRLSQVPAKYREKLYKRQVTVVENSAEQQAIYDLENLKLANLIQLRSGISQLKKLQASITTKVNVRNNQVIVPVDIYHGGSLQRLNLLLDTGASLTMVHAKSLSGFKKNQAKLAYAQVAGGGVVKTWLLKVQDLTFGPYHYRAKQIMVMEFDGNSSFDGLLGMDVLAATDYKIDFNNQRILWDAAELVNIERKIGLMNIQLDELK
ncbi:MAG: retropepsin-like domain-containing protein [Oceanospirillaceae bacterium]|nr:retropepsin-like domain-containing protein [Oceanospirillaceae bacterium]